MRQVTITVDKDKYERFRQDEEDIERNPKETIVRSLERGVRTANTPRPPRLSVAGKTKEGTKDKADLPRNNLRRIGPPPKPPQMTQIKLNIEDELHEELVRESERKGTSVRGLASKWATICMEASNPEMTETARDLYSYIGIPLIELLK